MKGSEFRVQGSGFRVQGSGFGVQGSGLKLEDLLPGKTNRSRSDRYFGLRVSIFGGACFGFRLHNLIGLMQGG